MSIILSFLPGRVGHRQRILRNSQASQPGARSNRHRRGSASNTVDAMTDTRGGPLILTQALWYPPTPIHTRTHTETPDENQNKSKQSTKRKLSYDPASALLGVPQMEWKPAFSSDIWTPFYLWSCWLNFGQTNEEQIGGKKAQTSNSWNSNNKQPDWVWFYGY